MALDVAAIRFASATERSSVANLRTSQSQAADGTRVASSGAVASGVSAAGIATQRASSTAFAQRDAEDLTIGDRIDGEVAALRSAIGNAGEGMALIEVADQGLAQIEERLTRMQEIAEQAAGDDVSRQERAYLDEDFATLRAEIDEIAQTTSFQGIAPLLGEQVETQVETTTTTTSFTAGSLGSALQSGDGFTSFSFVDDANGVSDGDVFEIAYDEDSGDFTVTNTTINQVETAAGPGGEVESSFDVDVAGFGLTIRLNKDFDDEESIDGAAGPRQFTVTGTTSEETTVETVTINRDPLDIRVGSGVGAEDVITIWRVDATTAGLAAGLDTASLSGAASAATAEGLVDTASEQAAALRAQLRADSVSLAAAAGVAGEGLESVDRAENGLRDQAAAEDFARTLGEDLRTISAQALPVTADGLRGTLLKLANAGSGDEANRASSSDAATGGSAEAEAA